MWIKAWFQGKTMLVVFVLLILALSGCVESSSWGNAPDFTLETIDGDTFTLSDHLGKVILLDFMYAGCGWCIPQMETLDAIVKERGDEIVVVSIDAAKGQTEEDVRQYFGECVGNWTFVFDNYEEDATSKYQITGYPTTVIINKKGDISGVHRGLTGLEALSDEIDKANK